MQVSSCSRRSCRGAVSTGGQRRLAKKLAKHGTGGTELSAILHETRQFMCDGLPEATQVSRAKIRPGGGRCRHLGRSSHTGGHEDRLCGDGRYHIITNSAVRIWVYWFGATMNLAAVHDFQRKRSSIFYLSHFSSKEGAPPYLTISRTPAPSDRQARGFDCSHNGKKVNPPTGCKRAFCKELTR